LAFAVAGVFNADIYCVSVNDPDFTEGGFLSLLSHLSRRSILLLEDVDSAGLRRKSHRSNNRRNESGISLSGLVNAIDSVASSEGRILIITVNMLDHLDGALTRPGRIDVLSRRERLSQMQPTTQAIVGLGPALSLTIESYPIASRKMQRN
jgi:mitochondrial chaperone BCS1